jgi:pimeloyl-ACP methyl ester carboxylesterase
MKGIRRFRNAAPVAVVAALSVVGTFASASMAQEYSDVQVQKKALNLKAVGSFYIDGETVFQTATEVGLAGEGHLNVNQMYVGFMVPSDDNKVPVVMVHGATLSGKTYETTPDGRMGWEEYFARNGHAVYVPDQVSRGRSGFNQAIFNDVRAGISQPSALPNIWRVAVESAWTSWRVGAAYPTPFPGSQFNVKALNQLANQGVPDLNLGLPAVNPTWNALSVLASEVNGGAVILGHSQAGRFPFEAALVNIKGIRGLIAVEPAAGSIGCAGYSDDQIKTLSRVPILVVFGDHTEGTVWQDRLTDCRAFAAKIQKVGGNATVLHLPEIGVRGNTHMMMQDKNSLQVADLIMRWLDKNIRKTSWAYQPQPWHH